MLVLDSYDCDGTDKDVAIAQIFDLKKIDELDGDHYWENYRKLFGSGKSSNSVPIFNKSKTVAIIQIEGQGDYLLGFETIIVYLKINGKWKYYTEKQLWIS